MLNETFYLDGIDARSVGIHLQAPVEFSEAVPVVQVQSIPGRNGDLVWETGSYENRSGSASCFCLQKDVEKAISSAGRFLMGKKGYRRLETSDDPDHFWLARVENSPQIAMRLRTLAPFDVGFDCKPQRFLKDGEQKITLYSDGSIYNPYGQTSLPLIVAHCHGNGSIIVDDSTVEINRIDGVVYLDSETQNAYSGFENVNSKIFCENFPALKSGTTKIYIDGDIEKIEMIPRWWEL